MAEYKLSFVVDAQDKGATGVLGKVAGGLGGIAKFAAGGVLAGGILSIGNAMGDLGGALMGMGKDALGVAADFESSMADLGIAAKESGLSYGDLKKAAMAVGGDVGLVGVSASGSAEALTELYKAGLTTTEIFGDLQGYMAGTAELGGALRAGIDGAASTELNMAAASKLAAVTLATFGSELKTEGERAGFITAAMNNFAQAADASAADVSGLAQAMVNVGPTAASFGFGLEDTNNALAILSMRGIEGGEAGTALKSMLTNMMRPTEAVTGALGDLGVSLYDEEGAMRSLPNIIGQLEKSMSGLTEEERNAYVQTLAGTYGMKAMQTLLMEGTVGWGAMSEATANAATIQEQAAAKGDTFAGKMEALGGVLETLKINAIGPLLPSLTDLVGMGAELIESYGPQLTEVFTIIGDVLASFIGGAPTDFPWEDIFPPWLADIAYDLSGHFETIMEKLKGLMSGELTVQDLIPESWIETGENLKVVFDDISAWWAEHGPGIQESAGELFEELKVVSKDLKENILPWLAEKFDVIGAWFKENGPLIEEYIDVIAEWWGVLSKEVGKAWKFIEPLLDFLIQEILGIAEIIMQVSTGDWPAAWETMKEIVVGAWEMIKEVWNAFADWVSGWFGTTWAEVMAGWETNWQMLETIVTTIWDNITGTISTAIENIKKWVGEIGQAIMNIKLPGWMIQLADKLSIKLPDYMMGKSSPPLAIWITDITDAMRELARVPMSPAFSAAMATSIGYGSTRGRLRSTVNTIGSHNVYNVYDERAARLLMDRDRRERRRIYGGRM